MSEQLYDFATQKAAISGRFARNYELNLQWLPQYVEEFPKAMNGVKLNWEKCKFVPDAQSLVPDNHGVYCFSMANITMDIDQEPWVGVIWDPIKQRIVGKSSDRTLIASIISHTLGLKINLKIRDLKQKYRDTIGDKKAVLLSPITWSGRATHTLSEDDLDTED